jgi:hypothetical protein
MNGGKDWSDRNNTGEVAILAVNGGNLNARILEKFSS